MASAVTVPRALLDERVPTSPYAPSSDTALVMMEKLSLDWVYELSRQWKRSGPSRQATRKVTSAAGLGRPMFAVRTTWDERMLLVQGIDGIGVNLSRWKQGEVKERVSGMADTSKEHTSKPGFLLVHRGIPGLAQNASEGQRIGDVLHSGDGRTDRDMQYLAGSFSPYAHAKPTYRICVSTTSSALTVCTHATPILKIKLKILDHWPALPIVVQYGGLPGHNPPAPEDEDNIMAALKQSDRVASISRTVTSSKGDPQSRDHFLSWRTSFFCLEVACD
ncbi:hypothetical protein V8E53_015262 [Lactarius tabidus]